MQRLRFPPFDTSLRTIADLSAVLAFAGPIAPLPEQIERYRSVLYLIAAIASAWLVRSLNRRWSRFAKLGSDEVRNPQIVLVEGTASQNVKNDSSGLKIRQCFRVKTITLADAKQEFTKDHLKTLNDADAVVLMPGFTRAAFPSAYTQFVNWRWSHPKTVVGRYRPADLTSIDFQCVPFRNLEDFVNFASQFLMRRATDQDSYIHRRRSLCARSIAFVAVVAAGIMVAYAVVQRGELQVLRRMNDVPAATRHRIAIIAAGYRAAMESARNSADRFDAKREYLNGWAKVETDEINRIFRMSDPKMLAIYLPSLDGELLEPIVSHGFAAYPIHGANSIAGCAWKNRAVVYWQGERDRTSGISAWTLRGESVGQYDRQTQRLVLSDGSGCVYDNRQINDPKNQLLCIPLYADDARTVLSLPAVLCLSADEQGHSLSDPSLHRYLLRTAPTAAILVAPPTDDDDVSVPIRPDS